MTLRAACRTRNSVLRSGMNHGADTYTKLVVFDRAIMFCVQVFCVISTVEFIGVAQQVPARMIFGVIVTGLLRTAISIFVAVVAATHWWIYRKACRDEK